MLDIVEPSLSGTALTDMTQDQIVSVFKKAMDNEYVWPYYFGLFDQWVDADAPVVQVIRSSYQFGSPIQVKIDDELIRYKDISDRNLEQMDHFNKILIYPFIDDVKERFGEVDETGFEAIDYSYSKQGDELADIAT